MDGAGRAQVLQELRYLRPVTLNSVWFVMPLKSFLTIRVSSDRMPETHTVSNSSAEMPIEKLREVNITTTSIVNFWQGYQVSHCNFCGTSFDTSLTYVSH